MAGREAAPRGAARAPRLSVSTAVSRPQRWAAAAACTWCVLFGAPHLWWALGIRTGFPGGSASYEVFMGSAWRYIYDIVVVVLSVVGFLVARELVRPAHPAARPWLPRTLARTACVLLTLRGVAGMLVDGRSDPVWWPTFLAGGILFGAVSWLARPPSARDLASP